MIDKDLAEEGYTEEHLCEAMNHRSISTFDTNKAIDFIAKKDGEWRVVCEDYYYQDVILFCPFCGEKL